EGGKGSGETWMRALGDVEAVGDDGAERVREQGTEVGVALVECDDGDLALLFGEEIEDGGLRRGAAGFGDLCDVPADERAVGCGGQRGDEDVVPGLGGFGRECVLEHGAGGGPGDELEEVVDAAVE